MKRYFWLISTAGVFLCGTVLHSAYDVSGKTAWSIIISSVNNSPWEMTKPFALVYVMWVFIEMSCLRPSLLHFVCSKIITLYFFVISSVLLLRGAEMFFQTEKIHFVCSVMVFVSLLFSEIFSYVLYRSKCRTERFYIPLLILLMLFVSAVLFLTVHPIEWFPFYDSRFDAYGILA